MAHGLPTKYTDFLEWVKAEYALFVDLKTQRKEIVTKIKEIKINWEIVSVPSKIEVERIDNEKIQLEIWECIDFNVWIDFFLNNSKYINENWIDFESEISQIIKSIDADMQNSDFNDKIVILSNGFLKGRFATSFVDLWKAEDERIPEMSYANLQGILLTDLKKLIRALEIYLSEFVGKIKIHLFSPDIMKVSFDKVISFNYTDTYFNIYGKRKNIEYDYIHGKAEINNTLSLNNMVLGIDEYLSDERKNRDTEFIAFKKFFQRIHKETGSRYTEWIEEISEDFIKNGEKVYISDRNNLHIFGHSLNMTDSDVLRDLILCDSIYTIIYYSDKKMQGQQIANLIKVIGQDELIRRTGGRRKKIEFRQQQTMMTNSSL